MIKVYLSLPAKTKLGTLVLFSLCSWGCAFQQSYELIESVSVNDLKEKPAAPTFYGEPNGISATGYAVIDIQKGQSHAQRRLMAIRASKLDAYRGLAEQVYGLFLESSSNMSELSLANESVRARVQGLVYGSRLISIDPIGADTYATKLLLDRNIVDELIAQYRTPVERKRRVRVISEPEKNEKKQPKWSFEKRRWIRGGQAGG